MRNGVLNIRFKSNINLLYLFCLFITFELHNGSVVAGLSHGKCSDTDPSIAFVACKAIINSPDESASSKAEAFYRLVELKFFAGDRKGALADANEALRLNPKFAYAYNARGYLSEDSNIDSAISDYSKAIELDPNLSVAFNNRGAVLRDRGDLDAASRDLEQAIRLAPEATAPRLDRALLRERLDDFAGAMIDVEFVLNKNPNFQPAKDQYNRLRTKLTEKYNK